METTNKLKHTIVSKTVDGDQLFIKISLDDDCKNGHADFSITGDIYEADKPRVDRYFISGGCIHDEILAAHPELKLFIDLHLSDVNGAPMYATGNGFYHLKEGKEKVAQEYIRATDEEFEKIKNSPDEKYFTKILFDLGIVDRWKNEAEEAIRRLEEMTGQKFKDDSTRLANYKLSEKENYDLEEKIKSGYYSAEQIEKRTKEKIQADKEALKQSLKCNLDKKVKKATDDYNVQIAVLNAGLSIDNFIYYNHTNEGVFNWINYEKKVTKEEFEIFLKTVKTKGLPEGITFKLK